MSTTAKVTPSGLYFTGPISGPASAFDDDALQDLMQQCHASDLRGRTIADVTTIEVPSNWGPEVSTVLVFTDGTLHGFVHPSDDL